MPKNFEPVSLRDKLIKNIYSSKFRTFFSYIISGLKINITNSVPYASISPKEINVNPKLINNMEHLSYVLSHECLHLYLKHFERFKKELETNHTLVNYATDLAINSILGDINLDILFPSNFGLPENLSAEEYYYLLKKNNPDVNQGDGKSEELEGDNQGDKQQGKGDQKKDDDSQEEGDRKKDTKKGGKKTKSKLIDDLRDYKDIYDKFSKEEIKNFIQKIYYGLSNSGNTRVINFINSDTQPLWKILLTKWIGSIKKYKMFSYRREHRRMSEFDNIFIPYVYKEKSLNLAIAIDTSGSINNYFLSEVMSYLLKKNELINIKYIFSFDTQLYFYRNLKDILQSKSLQGGGGTSFVPIFEFLGKKTIDGLIIFTDGIGDYPKHFPKINTCWVTIDNKSINEYIKDNVPKYHLIVPFINSQ